MAELTEGQKIVVDTLRRRARSHRILATNLEKAARLIECGVECNPLDYDNAREVVDTASPFTRVERGFAGLGHQRRAACDALRESLDRRE